MFSAAAGILGFSALSGLLVTVMVAPAIAVTGVTAASTIGVFDSLPEYLEIGHQPEVNNIYAVYTGPEAENGYLKIATIYDQNRQEVAYDQISQFALDAAVDGEDRRFFEHGGVDVASVVRASVGNIFASGIESGASTLSMQLVKNIFVQQALALPTEEARDQKYEEATGTSFDRKLKEMKLAIGLEKNYTKKEILTAYLNIAFFGDNTYGIEAAAHRYFDVSAKDLTLAQSASLIAIVQYPGERGLDDPENYEANQGRRDVILGNMLDVGSITQEQYDEAMAITVNDEFLKPTTPQNGCMGANGYATWFCDYVVKSVKDFEFLGTDEADRLANWARGGYSLYTTLDLDAQGPAQRATWAFAPNTETAFALGSATSTVEAGTGRVLVMTENKDFNDTLEGGGSTTSAVNYNTSFDYGGSTGFQSGSTYKVFTLINWLQNGKGLYERVNGEGRTENQAKFKDSCEDGGGWGGPYPFKNAGGEKGIWSVLNGTVSSVNGVFISMALQLDLCNIRKTAESLGVERGDQTHLLTNPSSVLGTNEITPLSLAAAYAAIGAGGKWCKPIVIDKAIAPDGTDLGGQQQECRQAIDPEVAAATAFALRAVVTQGTGSLSYPGDGIPLIGKTGTTDNNNQTWMATATTRWGTAVWVGNSIDEHNMFNYSAGGTSGAYLRHSITQPTAAALNAKYPGGEFPAPAQKYLTGSGVTVPDVRGQTPEAAKALLEGLGFTYADGGAVDSEIEAGKVAMTDPAPGAQSGGGAVITVYISKGNKLTIPDVVGDGKTYDFATAEQMLDDAGFSNAQQACVPVPLGDPRIGKVVSQDPSAGSVATANQRVRLGVGQATPC